MNNVRSGFVRAVRIIGRALDSFGQRFEVAPFVETLQPSTRVIKFGKYVPSVASGSFLASTATVVGNVNIGSNSSIWYGAVVRGDHTNITIGSDVCIGDRVMVHVSGVNEVNSTKVEDRVVVGAGAILHGCVVESDAFIGEGAQVMDKAVVKRGAFVAAGALVGSGKVVPEGQMWGGIPARYVRDVTQSDRDMQAKVVQENVHLAKEHALASDKHFTEIEEEEFDFQQRSGRSEYYYKRMSNKEQAERLGEFENHTIPGRIFDSAVSSRNNASSRPSS